MSSQTNLPPRVFQQRCNLHHLRHKPVYGVGEIPGAYATLPRFLGHLVGDRVEVQSRHRTVPKLARLNGAWIIS